jgi:hypothetical protein
MMVMMVMSMMMMMMMMMTMIVTGNNQYCCRQISKDFPIKALAQNCRERGVKGTAQLRRELTSYLN